MRPWIHFEAGGAHLRGVPIIPLCHSDLKCAQLPVPLSEYEGIQLSEADGLAELYRLIGDALGSTVPEIDFQELAKEFAALETEYAKQRDLITEKPSLGKVVERILDPKALASPALNSKN